MYYTNESLLYFLESNNITYVKHIHKPLFTVHESKKLRGEIIGSHTKNLFLKDKKNNFFLLSSLEDKKIDLKKLKVPFATNNLSFASEKYLNEILKLKPGSVSPFGLINDTQKNTSFYLDKDILNNLTVNFHPMTNDQTINIKIKDFLKFIEIINVKLHIIDLGLYIVDK